MEPSSRTPEGEVNRCPICGKRLQIEPSRPPGDAPCPHCGHLLWFADLRGVEGVTAATRLSTRPCWPPGPEYEPAEQHDPDSRGCTDQPCANRWRAMFVAAAVGIMIGTISAAGTPDLPVLARLCVPGMTCVVSVIAALGLSLRDAVDRRVQRGQHVNYLLRIYFAPGFVSMAAWIATAIAVTFVAAMCSTLLVLHESWHCL